MRHRIAVALRRMASLFDPAPVEETQISPGMLKRMEAVLKDARTPPVIVVD